MQTTTYYLVLYPRFWGLRLLQTSVSVLNAHSSKSTVKCQSSNCALNDQYIIKNTLVDIKCFNSSIVSHCTLWCDVHVLTQTSELFIRMGTVERSGHREHIKIQSLSFFCRSKCQFWIHIGSISRLNCEMTELIISESS